MSSPKKQRQAHPHPEQEFHFTSPTAASVQLVGDFTHWQKNPIALTKGTDGVWRTRVAIEPGTHRYRFLVDAEWQDDPECTLRVANPFGTHDAVLRVDA